MHLVSSSYTGYGLYRSWAVALLIVQGTMTITASSPRLYKLPYHPTTWHKIPRIPVSTAPYCERPPLKDGADHDARSAKLTIRSHLYLKRVTPIEGAAMHEHDEVGCIHITYYLCSLSLAVLPSAANFIVKTFQPGWIWGWNEIWLNL